MPSSSAKIAAPLLGIPNSIPYSQAYFASSDRVANLSRQRLKACIDQHLGNRGAIGQRRANNVKIDFRARISTYTRKSIGSRRARSAVGKTYWVNEESAGGAPVNCFLFTGSSGPCGKLVTLATAHSFVVMELNASNSRVPVYKVKVDDGQDLCIQGDDFRRTLFVERDYASEGPGYLSIRQYIFTEPPTEITGAIDKKAAAAKYAAAVAKKAKEDAYAARSAKAEADFESRQAARMALGGVRIGMTRDQARHSSWQTPNYINITTAAAGQQEQWVCPEYDFLYLSNGILTGIENHSDDGVYGRAK